MVYAVIHSLVHSEDKKDLILLEFQGSFQSATESVKNVKIGDIEIEGDLAHVLIGHHRIEGSRKKLHKPLAVIHKVDKEIMDIDQGNNNDIGPAVEYSVTSIIREKFVFINRPRLIVKESLRGLTKIGGGSR
ncbi:uncharacterized protein BX664DRAFT_292016 [Halteromyces radiatus]|uniref:uncharacterized protein n=1 Tax=Halteromyces radiatus TaxID=101107 RepID=UPI00221E3D50|nr:uncharacterized protein BX664DRAFT_292016 [Halteromyces radiatus]KAI8096839.1 hypothetical protein BX664DRAFT_292016 [Halteromyces radiatus]